MKSWRKLENNPDWSRWRADRERLGQAAGLIGLDEVGRGCLAGPVYAAAVYLSASFFEKQPENQLFSSFRDSKKTPPAEREQLFALLRRNCRPGQLVASLGRASVAEISQHNILGATKLAMARAVSRLLERAGLPQPVGSDPLFPPGPESPLLIVDGLPLKNFPYPHLAIVSGDDQSMAIAMASILAKVARDRHMARQDKNYPDFDFASNKGYGSRRHLTALRKNGPCPLHRPLFLRKLL